MAERRIHGTKDQIDEAVKLLATVPGLRVIDPKNIDIADQEALKKKHADYLRPFTEKIETLRAPLPADIQPVVNQHYRDLIRDVTAVYDHGYQVRGGLSDEEIRHAVLKFFLRYQTQEPRVLSSRPGGTFWDDPLVIRPNHAVLLIMVYGLVDGVRMSFADIARVEHRHANSVRDQVRAGLYSLETGLLHEGLLK